MVFESLVVDLLNRLLGDYFENLDTSQLKLGIWGGDVVFHDLVLRNSALDNLDIPFKIVLGRLGTLTMKIPWKSLYTAPVELKLEDLLLLVAPSYAVKYDPESERKGAEFAKMKEIERIDDIRRKEQAKKSGKEAKTQADDSFTEKLITQVIKNVQVKIQTIHVRYEDNVTRPGSPFAFGFTLASLDVQTTDTQWNPTVLTDPAVQTFNKLCKIKGLSAYWNSQTRLVQQEHRESWEMLKLLRDFVVNDKNKLTHVLGPIKLTAKLTITPSPERGSHPFSTPKFWVNVLMEELALGLTNLQFLDMVELAEGIDLMFRAQLHRKYRPEVNIHQGHYKEWWKFAYRCILEEDIKRRHNNWNWAYLKKHRELCKSYANAYYQKLTHSKFHHDVLSCITHCEKTLDLFNITLVRKQVEMRIEKEGKLKDLEKLKVKPRGWFMGWVGGGGGAGDSPENVESGDGPLENDLSLNAILGKVEQALTLEEKGKLYSAIDYSENALPLEYPANYEEYCVSFKLAKCTISIREFKRGMDKVGRKLLDLRIDNVQTEIKTRPVKKGMSIVLLVDAITAFGFQSHSDSPSPAPAILTSRNTETGSSLLHLQYQRNPLDCSTDQKLVLRGQPVEIVYDSRTVSKLIACFKIPKHAKLLKLQEALASSLNNWKEQSVAGLQYMLDTRGEVEVDIQLVAPYLLIPQNGVLEGNNDENAVLGVDLGEIGIKSRPREKNWDKEKIQSFKSGFDNDTEHLEAMMSLAYDCFIIELTDFQVFLALPNEDYSALLTKSEPEVGKSLPKSLILAKRFVLILEQSMLPEETTLPRVQLHAHLPLLDFHISENRLLALLKLLITLPLPNAGEEGVGMGGMDNLVVGALDSIAENPVVAENYALSKLAYGGDDSLKKIENQVGVEFTEMLLKFTVHAVKIRVTRMHPQLEEEVPLLDFEMSQFKLKLQTKSYSTEVDVGVGGLTLCAVQNKLVNQNGPLYLLKTPMSGGSQKYLLEVHMFSILPKCPRHLAGTVKQIIKADISCLDVILHQEAIVSVLSLVKGVTEFIDEAGKSLPKPKPKKLGAISRQSSATSQLREGSKSRSSTNTQLSILEARHKALSKRHAHDPKDILLQIHAKMESLTVQLSYESKNLLKIALNTMEFSVVQKVDKMAVTLELTNLLVRNMDPNSLYQDIIAVEEDRVVYVHVMMFDEGTSGKNFKDMEKRDMSVRIVTGCPKIVYISSFVDNVLHFLTKLGTSRESLYEVSAAAAVAATETVGQAVFQAKSKRILLDVNINAPVIILPKNEMSEEALLADLGRLTLNNQFSLKEGKTGSGNEGIITEKLDVSVMDVKVSRIFFDKTKQNAKAEVLILEPVNCQLWIDRNVSAEWYHGKPEYGVKMSLAQATVKMAKEDYELVLGCIFENILWEKPKDSKESPRKIVEGFGQVVGKKWKSKSTLCGDTPKINRKMGVLIETQIFVEMGNIQWLLYGKNKGMLRDNEGVVKREQNEAFACVQVQNGSLKCELFSDQSVNCAVKIGNVSLMDIRTGPNRAITNLIQRKLTGSGGNGESSKEPMFKFGYKFWSQANGTTGEMEIQTTSLTLVLAVDYLMLLVNFFKTQGPAADLVKQNVSLRLKPSSVAYFASSSSPTSKQSQSPAKSLDFVEKSDMNTTFNAFYNFSSTEVILVETLSSLDTKALLLHCEVAFKQTDTNGKWTLMGSVSNLKLLSCVYNPMLRESSSGEVVSPTVITLVWNCSPKTGSLIDVTISNVFVRLTAGTVELLSKIFEELGESTRNSLKREHASKENYLEVWQPKPNDCQNFWFLKAEQLPLPLEIETGQDALDFQSEIGFPEETNEKLVLESGSIVFTFETGSGANTVPLMLLETDIDLQMSDWSTSYLKVCGKMKLEAAYYNAMYGMWEFLVEPVQSTKLNKTSHQPWELCFELAFNSLTKTSSLLLQSNDILELTLTKTALHAISIISQDFSQAVKTVELPLKVSTAPYTVINQTGMDIKLFLKEKGNKSGPVQLIIKNDKKLEQFGDAVLKHGSEIDLGLSSGDKHLNPGSILREQEQKTERFLAIEIAEMGFKTEIGLNRSVTRYYSLERKWGLIVDIGVRDCSKVVTLRGIVQIVNDLKVNVEVYYSTEEGGIATLAGGVEPGKIFNLPLAATHTDTRQLFFAPEGCSLTTEPFKWEEVFGVKETVRQLTAYNRLAGQKDFNVRVVGIGKQVLNENSNRKTLGSQCCTVYLKAPVLLDNLLPVKLGYFIGPGDEHRMKVAERGSVIQVTNLNLLGKEDVVHLFLKIVGYLGQSWKCEVKIGKGDNSQWGFVGEDGTSLTLGIQRVVVNEEIVLKIYCPFWMVNRTGLDLVYRGDGKGNREIRHLKEDECPVLFSFGGKAFFGKKKSCRVRIDQSGVKWSEKFGLNEGGIKNSVSCRGTLQSWQFGVEIEMSICGLTRYIVFSPRFYLVNECPFSVYSFEVDRPDSKIEVGSGQIRPFWPKGEVKQLKAVVKLYEGRCETKAFSYGVGESTLLKLDNELGGIEVDVEVNENRTMIRFGGFKEEKVPVVVVNGWQGIGVEFGQIGDEERKVVDSGHWRYFTWGYPLASRLLEWGPVGMGKKWGRQTDLKEDCNGSFEMNGGSYYWISFLNGEQRILLFTENLGIVQMLGRNDKEEDKPLAEFIVNLHGLGLSLVDNENLKEVLYLRIASSEILWEQKRDGKRKRFKPLSLSDSKNVETAYQTYLKQVAGSKGTGAGVRSVVSFDSGLEVDFYFMRGRMPHETTLRRNFQTGVWLSWKQKSNGIEFRAKLNRIQIDNQLPDAIFRVVLAPIKPGKTVMKREDEHKPFMEICVKTAGNRNVVQYKMFRVSVQEFCVRIDIQWVNALVELLVGNVLTVEEWRIKYKMEYEEICVNLEEFLETQKIVCQGKKHFYDELYLSPLKIHLSFSMVGGTNVSNDVLKVLLASLGVTLTEVHDVVFKLACFEMQHRFLSKEQLKQEVRGHYVSQGLKQFYVLLFGLDVIGNPYGLAVGVAKGLETFFYEPFQGAIQGPGQFAQGVVYGVKSLVEGTIGGTAGAMSRITGTLGKGVAALTFDPDYQRKRREQLHQNGRGDAVEVLARSGFGLWQAMVEGVSGVVTKPVEGWRENRALGFLKGVVTGTVGLVVKPVSGIVDFASGSLEAVKKVTSNKVEIVRRLRAPRYIPADGFLRPFVCREAEGVQLLGKVEKGRFSGTDEYVAHALINPLGNYVLVVTNRRVLYLKHNKLCGAWKVEWNWVWEELAGPPVQVDNGLLLELKEEMSRKVGLFVVAREKRVFVPIYSAEVATWLVSKVEEAMRIETGRGWADNANNFQDSGGVDELTPLRLARANGKDGF